MLSLGDPTPQYLLCAAVWFLAILWVRTSIPTENDFRRRMLTVGIAAGLAREVFCIALEVLGPRPLRGQLVAAGFIPALEAWVQAAGALILVGGFLTYFAHSPSVGTRYLKAILPLHTVASIALLTALFLTPGNQLLGAPRPMFVMGLIGLGFCMMLAGVVVTLRSVHKNPDRWIMAVSIAFFLGSVWIRGSAHIIPSAMFRPPMDVPYSVTASAIGVVLLGYLFVRSNTAEVRSDMHELEEQVRQRTAHLQQALENLEVANSKLVEQSTIDGLTGLHNRRYFDEALEAELARAARTQEPLAVALVDLDHFKNINDRYGHAKGDACLLFVASLLKSKLRRPGDVTARYGGDELAAIMPNTSEEGAAAVMNAIRRELEAPAGKPAAELSISIGLASCVPDAGCNAAGLVRCADKRLYAAKQAGRNRVCSVVCSAEVGAAEFA